MNTPTESPSTPAFVPLRNFIFDLDGVIWRGSSPIDGAVESVARLKAAGNRCFYCTNNSRHEPAAFANKLREIGIEATAEEVMTSSLATVFYLQSQFTGPFSAYVIGEEGLVSMLRRTGALVTTSPIIPQRTDLHGLHGEVDCVVVGIDATFSYHKMRVAQWLITNGAQFIATNRDSTFPTPHGVVPGAGAIVASIETATGVSPVVLGKPQPLMLQLLMQRFSLAAEETAMVGDRIDTDMTAGHRAGVRAILVTTGIHSAEQGRRAKGEQKPDAVYVDMVALCDSLQSNPAKVAEAVASGVDFHSDPAPAPEQFEHLETPIAPPSAPAEAPVHAVLPIDPVPAEPPMAVISLDKLKGASAAPTEMFSWLVETPASTNGSREAVAPPAPTPPPATTAVEAAGAATAPPFTWQDEVPPLPGENAETIVAPVAPEFPVPQPPASPTAAAAAPTDEGDDHWWESLDKLV